MGDQGYGISPPTIERIAAEVKSVHDMNVQICMVIVVEIFSEACRGQLRVWKEQLPIIWVCWLLL